MRDALRKNFTGLDGRDDPMFKKTSGAISCRLLVWWFPRFPRRIKIDIVSSSPGTQQTVQLR